MRILVVLFCVGMAGCAALPDRIIGGQTASDKLRAELGADINLQAALREDIAKKSAQLTYVSYGTYSCGTSDAASRLDLKDLRNPPLPRVQKALLEKKKKDREAFLRAKYADFAAVMLYGEALSKLISDHDDRVKAYANLKNLIGTYKGYVPSEFAIALKFLNDAIGAAQLVDKYAFQAAVLKTARASVDPLAKARANIVSKGILKVLSADEERAFRLWDACALDRLWFLREYDPSRPPNYLVRNKLLENTAGEMRSPVLLFVNEYKTYLNEREAFVAQRSDYIGLIDAVISANLKIANFQDDMDFNDLLVALNEIGQDAGKAKEQFNALEKDINA